MTQKITLDIIPSGDFIREVVRLKQGDHLTRTIAVKLTEGGSPFTVPAGSTVRLRGTKVDGTGFMIPSSGYSQTDGYTFVLSNDNLGVAGLIKCDVAYYYTSGDDIPIGSTELFYIDAVQTALDPGTYIGTNDYADLLQAIIHAESLRGIASVTLDYFYGRNKYYNINYTDGDVTQIVITDGEQGATGETGATGNGIASVVKTSTSGLIDTYTITFTNGDTTTFTVTNGDSDISAVKYTVAQELTDAQKAQARENITDYDDVVQIIKLTSQATSFGEIKDILDEVNSQGKHVFFDVSALATQMYLCTIFIDSAATSYKINDLVNQRTAEGNYEADKLITVAMASASNYASQMQIDNLQAEINELKRGEIGAVTYFNYIESLSVSSSSGNLSFTIDDEQDFITAVNSCEQTDYLLIWDGTAWVYNEQPITNFGITVTGTPELGEVMTVSAVVEKRSFTVVGDSQTGTNATVPANGSTSFYMVEQTYTLQAGFNFDAPESALCVCEGHTLAAGKYYVYNVADATGDYWCNNKRLYYLFEIPHDIIATAETGDITLRYSSRGARETTGDARGIYQLYVKPYCEATNELYNSDTIEFVGQIAAPSGEYTDIHTLAGFSTDQRMVIAYDDRAIIYNNLGHVCYGNNEWNVSNLLQIMNSSEKSITNPVRMHKNDVVTSLNGKRGDMWGLDPRVKALILDARTSQVHGVSDEFTKNTLYTSEQKAFLLSMVEMSFNIQTTEGIATTLYSNYCGGVLNSNAVAARGKGNKAGSTPSDYRWSRSPNSNSGSTRGVSAAGGDDSSSAGSALRRAPAYLISKS